MTAKEIMQEQISKGIVPNMVVSHREHGTITVPAFHPVDAKLQAMILWDVKTMDGMQVSIKKEHHSA